MAVAHLARPYDDARSSGHFRGSQRRLLVHWLSVSFGGAKQGIRTRMTGSLSTALRSSAQAMSVSERAFNVIQNKSANANTPGYVEQEQTLVAMPFDPNTQLSGGVAAGPVVSSRSECLEQNVRIQ